ncbi:MAG: hypothetical protein ACO2ZM_00955 [Francisellaceae bacterium]
MEKFVQEVLVFFIIIVALVVFFYVFTFLFWLLLIAIAVAIVYRAIKYIVCLITGKKNRHGDDL